MHCTERRAEDNDQNGMFVRSHGFLRIESGGSSAPRQILFEVSVGNFRPDGTRHIPSHKIRPVVIEYFLVVLSKRTISFQKGANFSHRTDILRVAASRPITSYSPFLLNQKSNVLEFMAAHLSAVPTTPAGQTHYSIASPNPRFLARNRFTKAQVT